MTLVKIMGKLHCLPSTGACHRQRDLTMSWKALPVLPDTVGAVTTERGLLALSCCSKLLQRAAAGLV